MPAPRPERGTGTFSCTEMSHPFFERAVAANRPAIEPPIIVADGFINIILWP